MKSFGNQKKRREKSEEVYINGKINFFMFKRKHCILLFCVGFDVPNYYNFKKLCKFPKIAQFFYFCFSSFLFLHWVNISS